MAERARDAGTDRRRAAFMGVLAGLALLVVVLAASGASVVPATEGCCPWTWDVLDAREQEPLAPAPAATVAATVPDDADALGDVADLLVRIATVAVLTAAAYLLARAVWRTARHVTIEPRTDPSSWELATPTGRQELDRAVEAGLAQMADGEVDDAIVECWVRLERAAASAGVTRRPSETASELTVRVLERFDVPIGPTLRLLELYRRARYSDHRLGEDARTEAVAALREVRLALAVVAPS